MAINTKRKPPTLNLPALEQGLYEVALEAHRQSVDTGRFHYASVAVPCQDDPSWLPELLISTPVEDTVMYWRNHATEVTFVGVGSAMNIDINGAGRFSELRSAWASCKERIVATTPGSVQFMLGFSFGEEPHRDSWRGWPNGWLVLPRTLFISRPDGCSEVALSEEIGPDSVVETIVQNAMDGLRSILQIECQGTEASRLDGFATRPLTHRTGLGIVSDNQITFEARVASTAKEIQAGEYEKAVIARSVYTPFTNLSQVPNALRYLGNVYPTNTTFALRRNDQCFLGASPERLATVKDNRVFVDCLAGTIGRGASEAEDMALARWLQNSDKNVREHQLVVEGIQEGLKTLVDEVEVDWSLSILRLNNVQHLYSRVSGQLNAGKSLLDVAEQLHPTPAVSGYPKEAAMAAIARQESFDRGWYAGGIGVMDLHGDGDIAVTLRSALVSPNGAILFAGAGIMGDSDPTAEWIETTMKLKPMQEALEVEGRGQAFDSQ